jgi:CRISPR-associated protein Cmr2
MSAIIVLTIGPVQSYISQARRTQDLWQGSRILSYLASAGVYYALAEQTKQLAEVIYPSIEPPQADNIPNRIVVRWVGDETGARDCARGMENAIREAWQTLSANTMRYFTDSLNQHERETVLELWQEQESKWLECYWVVVGEDKQTYSENMQQANAALGARKLLRNFPQIHENGRKCSITGEHEALHVAGHYVEFWDRRKAEQRNLALLGKHERLSAISVIKRFAHEINANNHELQFPNRLPSTSSIAAAPFRFAILQKLDQNIDISDLRQDLRIFIDALLVFFDKPSDLFFTRDGRSNPEYFGLIEQAISKRTLDDSLVQQFRSIDGDFLFEDTLISKTIEEYSGRSQPPDRRLLQHAQQALSDLLKIANRLEIPRPQPYLAILAMDGDHMGKTLGGLRSSDQHKLFSKTLADFARNNVKRIIENEHLGRVIYAGGDDVLALLPVQDALHVAEALRWEFEAVIAAVGITNHAGEPVTASTGLAYIHHTHNLQDAVRAANDALKTAKNHYGRNAVAVSFLRRSGEPRLMGHKWEVNGVNIVDYMHTLVRAFGHELSRNLPYDVARIAYSMGDHVPQDAVISELERIIRRRLNIDNKTERKARAQELRSNVTALKAGYTWQNAQCWLELARFVAQKEGDA